MKVLTTHPSRDVLIQCREATLRYTPPLRRLLLAEAYRYKLASGRLAWSVEQTYWNPYRWDWFLETFSTSWDYPPAYPTSLRLVLGSTKSSLSAKVENAFSRTIHMLEEDLSNDAQIDRFLVASPNTQLLGVDPVARYAIADIFESGSDFFEFELPSDKLQRLRVPVIAVLSIQEWMLEQNGRAPRSLDVLQMGIEGGIQGLLAAAGETVPLDYRPSGDGWELQGLCSSHPYSEGFKGFSRLGAGGLDNLVYPLPASGLSSP